MSYLNASGFWKNFRLGDELHIAGSFIYNGLRRYHELQQLEYTDEVFDFLYNLAVGIERLLKIAIVLHEHSDLSDQEALEQSLITHSHLDLVARLRQRSAIKFSKPQNELLQLLGTFYKTLRYDRFSINSVSQSRKETAAILAFFSKHLKVDFPERSSLFGTPNEDRFRDFIQRTVLKISQTLYDVIAARSSALGLYTYELRSGSKAESIFLRKVKIADEDVLWKELLIFLMNTAPTTGYLKFLKQIEPLNFDPALLRDYLNCFKSDASKAAVMDELDWHYGEMDTSIRNERFVTIGIIGAENVYFHDPEDDESVEEDDDESI